MKITDLLKKLSLVAAVSAFALPSYASLSSDEGDVDEALEEAKVYATAVSGPLTFTIVDHKSGKKQIMTMTNYSVLQVVVNEEGFTGKHFYFVEGDDDHPIMASSNGIFSLKGTTFDLGAAMGEEATDLSELLAEKVTPFLDGVAASEDEALAMAKEKAHAKKVEAEEALAEEDARLKEEALAEEVKVEAEEVKVEAEEVKVEAEEVKVVKEGDEI